VGAGFPLPPPRPRRNTQPRHWRSVAKTIEKSSPHCKRSQRGRPERRKVRVTRSGDANGYRGKTANQRPSIERSALRRPAPAIRIERRVAHFRSLVIWPVFVGGATLTVFALAKRTCLSWIEVVVSAGSLELLASYYMAGTVVSTLTWLAAPSDIPRLLIVRLWVLGIAGFVSAVAIAVQLIAWRCS